MQHSLTKKLFHLNRFLFGVNCLGRNVPYVNVILNRCGFDWAKRIIDRRHRQQAEPGISHIPCYKQYSPRVLRPKHLRTQRGNWSPILQLISTNMPQNSWNVGGETISARLSTLFIATDRSWGSLPTLFGQQTLMQFYQNLSQQRSTKTKSKSWVHLTRKYQQIEFPMKRHHNQCFVKLTQLTDNKQEPTHDHNIHSTYNANSTLPLNAALILRPHAWVGCYFDSNPTIEFWTRWRHMLDASAIKFWLFRLLPTERFLSIRLNWDETFLDFRLRPCLVVSSDEENWSERKRHGENKEQFTKSETTVSESILRATRIRSSAGLCIVVAVDGRASRWDILLFKIPDLMESLHSDRFLFSRTVLALFL